MAILDISEFHAIKIDFLSKDSKLNTGHYISYIPSLLPEILVPYQHGLMRHFAILADNAKSHCAKTITRLLDHNSIRREFHSSYSPYSPYSSDLDHQTSDVSGL
jgi:hypothetical protein